MVVALFARLDSNGQVIPLRRQRTRRIGSKGTRRILRFIKVQRRLAIHWFICVEESSRAVSLARVGGVAEDDKERSVVLQGLVAVSIPALAGRTAEGPDSSS